MATSLNKLIKFITAALLVFACLIAAAACSQTPTKLDAPKNATIAFGVFTWEAVKNADTYIIEIEGEQHSVKETLYTLPSLGSGEYTARVKASSNSKKYSDSDWAVASFVVESPTEGLSFTKYSNGYQVSKGTANTSGRIVIPSVVDGVKVLRIADNAFKGCTELTSIYVPKGILSIGDSAFNGCTALTSIVLPDTVTTIDNSAFNHCTKLGSIVLSQNIAFIGEYAFFWCTSLQSIKIPDRIKSVGRNAFYGCSSLSDINFPESWTTIENATFGYTAFETLTIPNTIKTIKDNAFSYCSALKSITLHNDLTIGTSLFNFCTALESVTLPKTLKILPESTFYSCSSLASIELPDLTQVDARALAGTGFLSFTFPSSVRTIGDRVFEQAVNLQSVTFPKSLTTMGVRTFPKCDSISTISIESGNSQFAVEGNCLIKISSKTVICGTNSSVIPDYVTKIGEAAFAQLTQLKSIVIPPSVTSIANGAFSDCSSLSVILPSTVETIASKAFSNCTVYVNCSSQDPHLKNWIGGFFIEEHWHSGSTDILYSCTYGYDGDIAYVDSFTRTGTGIFYVGKQQSGNVILPPYRSGYTFEGWTTIQGSTVAEYTMDSIGSSPYSPDDETPYIYYTVWKKI